MHQPSIGSTGWDGLNGCAQMIAGLVDEQKHSSATSVNPPARQQPFAGRTGLGLISSLQLHVHSLL